MMGEQQGGGQMMGGQQQGGSQMMGPQLQRPQTIWQGVMEFSEMVCVLNISVNISVNDA